MKNHSDNHDKSYIESHSSIAFFCLTIAFVLASIYYTARITLDNPIIPVSNTLGISFFLLLFPQIYRLYIKPKLLHFHNDLIVDSLIPLISLILLIIGGFINSNLNINIVFLYSLLGFMFALVIVSKIFINSKRQEILIFLLLTLMFSLWLCGVIWGNNYLHPNFQENLIQGQAHIDTLFHAAISNLIKTHGIASTGIDGIIYLPYHTASHWIFAQLSNLLNIDILTFYQLGYPVIFIPFFFFNILSFAIFYKEFNHGLFNVKLMQQYLFWLILFIGFIQFIPRDIAYNFAVWDSHFIGESHGVGLSFIFIAFSLTIAFINYYQNRLYQDNVNIYKLGFTGIAIIFFISLITVTKVSLGALLCAVCVYFNFRLRKELKIVYVINIILAVATFLIAYKLIKFGGTSYFSLFAFQQQYVGFGKLFWVHYFFFWSFLYLLLKFVFLKLKTIGDVLIAYSHKQIIDVELVFLFAVIGVIPSLLLDIPGGSAGYFMDLQRWFALALILAQIDDFKKFLNFSPTQYDQSH